MLNRDLPSVELFLTYYYFEYKLGKLSSLKQEINCEEISVILKSLSLFSPSPFMALRLSVMIYQM
jgi:hypothetical protein